MQLALKRTECKRKKRQTLGSAGQRVCVIQVEKTTLGGGGGCGRNQTNNEGIDWLGGRHTRMEHSSQIRKTKTAELGTGGLRSR